MLRVLDCSDSRDRCQHKLSLARLPHCVSSVGATATPVRFVSHISVMADEIFEFELDGVDGSASVPESQLRQRTDANTDAVVLATSSAIHDDVGPVPPSGSGALASSVPISIPSQLSFRRYKGDARQAPEPDSFVPPHTLAQQAALAESLPLSSSSRIRTRNKVFRSMGYLPTNSQQGFLVSRTGDRSATQQSSNIPATVQSAFAVAAARSSGGSARVVTPAARPDARDTASESSTPSAAGRGPWDFARTTTGLSIAAAIPERDDLEAPSL
eukprot:jgi/Ulvmu1/6083/UM027_0061.1